MQYFEVDYISIKRDILAKKKKKREREKLNNGY